MRITHQVRYDASVEDVYAMLADPDFRERATLAQGALNVVVAVDGTQVTITIERLNDDVPAFARKIAGETVTAVQSESWADDAYEADFSVQPRGVPFSITGTRRLVEDGDATLDIFEGEAHARVPLIAGKLEAILRDKLVEGWNAEHGVGTVWLAGERG